MYRPLAWVLAAIAAGLVVLLFLVPDSAPDSATPNARDVSAGTAPHTDALALAGTPAEDAPPGAAGDRKAIASPEAPIRWVAPPVAAATPVTEGQIDGRVVGEEDGRYVPGAQVELEYTGPLTQFALKQESGPTRARAMLRTDGTFSCGGLRLGEWTVNASAAGRGARVERVVVTTEQPNASVLLKLPPQRVIRVSLVDGAGQVATAASLGVDPWIADLLCVAAAPACAQPGSTFLGDGSLLYRARGTGAGILSWSLEILGLGPVCIHLLRGDYVVTARELFTGETEVELRIRVPDLLRDMASCDVSVVDADHGGPLAGVLVRFLPTLGKPREALTDSDGRASAGPLPAGEITLHASAKGYSPSRQVARIPVRERAVLRLAKGRRVEGTVLDLLGAPIEGVPVSIVSADDSRKGTSRQALRTVTSGAGGRFAFDSLAHEEFVVTALRLRAPRPESPDDLQSRLASGSRPKTAPAPTAPVESQTVDLRFGDALAILLRVDREGS